MDYHCHMGKPRHGDSSPSTGGRTTEYSTWMAMRQRCANPKAAGYAYYGGRGVRVCERWAVFENFLSDMGRKPSEEHSLDRINPNGNYEPGNCRWTTIEVQAGNKRNSRRIFVEGEEKTASAWARDLTASDGAVRARIRMGWSPEAAATRPVQKKRRDPIECRGESRLIADWARISGTPAATIRHRLQTGWSSEDAIFSPAGSHGTGRKTTRFYTVNGETLGLEDWAKRVGIGRTTIEARLARGLSIEVALGLVKATPSLDRD